MAAPATLSLSPCAGLSSACSNRVHFPHRPPVLLPPRPLHLHRRLPSLPFTRAIAVDSNLPIPPQPTEQEKPRRYYFAVANAKFMLDDEEHFQELLFERLRNYGERKKEQDFWLVAEPKFLDKFPNITKRLKRPAVALVSTDGTWITFMKLRLDKIPTTPAPRAVLDSSSLPYPMATSFVAAAATKSVLLSSPSWFPLPPITAAPRPRRSLSVSRSNALRVSAAAVKCDPSKVIPQADRVLIRLEALPEKSSGGVLLPKSAVKFERYLMGEILSVGTDVAEVEAGKKVLFSDINAYEVDLDSDVKHCFCRASDLLAVVE